MAATYHQLNLVASVFLFISLLLISNLPNTLSQDSSCPYPCYPPPTGIGSGTPTVGTTLSPPVSQSGSFSPPSAGTFPSPTTGNSPNIPPPPVGNNNNVGPPSPDPILPYFPFYYRKPLHSSDQSWATSLPAPTAAVTSSFVVLFFLYGFIL